MHDESSLQLSGRHKVTIRKPDRLLVLNPRLILEGRAGVQSACFKVERPQGKPQEEERNR